MRLRSYRHPYSENSNYGGTITISPTQQLAMSRFVSKTYGWMFFGLMVTALVSFFIASSESAMRTIASSPGIVYGSMIAEFVVVLGLSAAYRRLSATAATLGFLFYSALNGVTFSLIFLAYTSSSIAQIFFITSAMFGGLALFGSVTKKDLTAMGAFVGMGLWGIILVGLVNVFVRSESLSMGLSVVSVFVFAGLTAWDAQKIRVMAYQSTTGGIMTSEANKGAIYAALQLYLDFINLFLSLLRLFGNRRE